MEPYNSNDQFNNVISIHDSQLIHSSWPNLSGEPRQVFAIRYMPSTSEYRKKDHIALSRNHDGGYDHRELFLVSGKDLNSKINKSLPLLKLW